MARGSTFWVYSRKFRSSGAPGDPVYQDANSSDMARVSFTPPGRESHFFTSVQPGPPPENWDQDQSMQ
jgi:hypothetical protein